MSVSLYVKIKSAKYMLSKVGPFPQNLHTKKLGEITEFFAMCLTDFRLLLFAKIYQSTN